MLDDKIKMMLPADVAEIKWDGSNTMEVLEFLDPIGGGAYLGGHYPKIAFINHTELQIEISVGDSILRDYNGKFYKRHPGIFKSLTATQGRKM